MENNFIVFEGVDHSGKTTQIDMLKEKLEDENFAFTREPGGYGIKICEKIRSILLDSENNICPETEAYLYAASRAQHVKHIKSLLTLGKNVICDRYYYSSLVYQGEMRGLGIRDIMQMNKMAIGGLNPDVIFYIRINIDTYMERKQNQKTLDRIEKESEAFFEKVIDNYDFMFHPDVINNKPSKVIVIDGNKSPEEVHEEIMLHMKKI